MLSRDAQILLNGRDVIVVGKAIVRLEWDVSLGRYFHCTNIMLSPRDP